MMKKMKHFNTLKIIVVLILLSTFISAEVIYTRQQIPLDSLVNGGAKYKVRNRPRIGLALSGGGARGIAQVGVLKAFEKHNIPIDLIVGSSIGSIIGGLYCAGYSANQLEKIVKQIGWNDLFQDETQRENLFLEKKKENDRYLLNIRFDDFRPYIPSSLTPGQKLLSILSEKLLLAKYQATKNFDQLRIPFRAVATDLISGKRLVIEKGDLAEAINASSAVPLLFSPVEWNGKLLIDGGVRSNIPVDVVRNLGIDVVIAVDITSPLRSKDELRAPWEIADQVTSIMMGCSRKEQLMFADVIIKPDLEGFGNADFDKIQEMIDQGEKSFDSVLYDLYSIIDHKIPLILNQTFPFNKFEFVVNNDFEVLPDSGKLFADKSRQLNLDMIKEDVDYLFSTGHYEKISAEYKIFENDTTLVYRVNPFPSIDSVSFHGNTVFSDSTINSIFIDDSMFTCNYNQLILYFNKIKDYYRAKGYSLMKIDSVNYDSSSHTLNIKINEGKIDSINISGNKTTKDIVILREFTLSTNDIFNAHTARQGIENIYNTQLFDRAGVQIKNVQNKNILTIKVKEKKFTVLKLGGKAGSERGAQGYMDLANENFLGQGNNLSLVGRLGEMDRSVSLNFRSDRIFKSYFTFSLHGYYSWQRNPFYVGLQKQGEFLEERRGGRLIFGQQLKKLGQLTVEFRLENVKDKQYSDRHTKFFDRTQNSELRTLTIRSVADKRDRIGFTTDGIYNVWYWESGNERILESQESYTKAFIHLEGYYTNWPGHTFHVKFNGGFADKTLPFSEYFRIGGLKSFMGLHENEMMGRQVIVTNLEYRYKFPFKTISDTYIGFRYDIGAIWEAPDLIFESRDFFYGAGTWLGFDTLLGPLLLGYGKRTGDHGSFYISLGYDF
jgi:NTE family protein